MKFKVGDKVRLIGDPQSRKEKKQYYGEVATIAHVAFGNMYPYSVEEHTGWLWRDTELELVEMPKIVITTDNVKVVTAKMYVGGKVVKTAEAKCAPEDTFDFAVGATLACDRLTNAPKKPKLYNGKLVCVDNRRAFGGDAFTVGKVYNVVNGKVIDNDGKPRPMTHNVLRSVSDLKNDDYFKTWVFQFIPFVEG